MALMKTMKTFSAVGTFRYTFRTNMKTIAWVLELLKHIHNALMHACRPAFSWMVLQKSASPLMGALCCWVLLFMFVKRLWRVEQGDIIIKRNRFCLLFNCHFFCKVRKDLTLWLRRSIYSRVFSETMMFPYDLYTAFTHALVC